MENGIIVKPKCTLNLYWNKSEMFDRKISSFEDNSGIPEKESSI